MPKVVINMPEGPNSEIIRYLNDKHAVGWALIDHEPRSTAAARADVLVGGHGLKSSEIVKVVLLCKSPRLGRKQWSLVVLPAKQYIRMELARDEFGGRVRLATESEIKERTPWCQLGCLPALGGLLQVPQYVDPRVLSGEAVVFPAGVPSQSIRLAINDLKVVETDLTVAMLS
ncbi:YbaK/EbsC family protein [Streptomyces sp. 5.8]|uniref:YbaK/EbsC family protein n=1 Tax=Streptomyces sp. 5.8 TaxID=3406571 RepID=UPI003BB523FB